MKAPEAQVGRSHGAPAMIRAIINGKPYPFRQGGTILAALRALGLDVPTLCHDDRLKPQGACRLCVVTVK